MGKLLLHSEIRWLSRGKVLARLFQLRHEILLFLSEHNPDFASLIVDEWLLALSYLSDIFYKLNYLNLSLQGKSLTVLDAYDKINAFEKKTGVMDCCIKDRKFAPFPRLESFLVKNGICVYSEFLGRVCNYLKTVKQNFETYFPNNVYEKFIWVRDPFQAYSCETDLSLSKKEQLIELSSDSQLKMQFRDLGLP